MEKPAKTSKSKMFMMCLPMPVGGPESKAIRPHKYVSKAVGTKKKGGYLPKVKNHVDKEQSKMVASSCSRSRKCPSNSGGLLRKGFSLLAKIWSKRKIVPTQRGHQRPAIAGKRQPLSSHLQRISSQRGKLIGFRLVARVDGIDEQNKEEECSEQSRIEMNIWKRRSVTKPMPTLMLS